MSQGVPLIVFPVNDIARAKTLYKALLGAEPYADAPYYVGFKVGDQEIGLDPNGPYLLFPANPSRPEKRHDRAAALAREAGAELLTGGGIEPDRMPFWINSANAVLVTSDYEGFGLVALESLACEVPVLSTPVGIAPHALGGVPGCLVAPYDTGRWMAAVRPHLDADDTRVPGAQRAAAFSADRMAERVLVAYREVLDDVHL